MKVRFTQEAAEEAFAWLEENREACALARARRKQVEFYREALLNKIMKEHPTLAVASQMREAKASDRYVEFLAGFELAVARDEELTLERENQTILISAWQSANKGQARV